MKEIKKQNRTIKIAVLVLLTFVVLISVAIKIHNANRQTTPNNNLYTLQATVTEINHTTDTVTVEDMSGNLWSFTGVEDWQVNDGCTLIMDSNGTENVTDDKILSETYNGVHESSLSDMTYIDKSSDNSFTLEDKNGKLYILFTDDNGNIQR
ncbi:MAG: hypothetical protein KHZ96_07955 [Coprobacillus sp.]|nr:hypothetical protein [Coprobacillus sp.]